MTTDIVLLIIFLLGSAYFSGMETGLVSINRLRLQHIIRQGTNRQKKRAGILSAFLDNPEHLLGTTLTGTNLCNVAFSVVAARLGELAMKNFPLWLSGALIIAMTSLVVLIFGEYLPKAWFQSRPTTRSMRFASSLRFFKHLFLPVSYMISNLAKIIVRAPEGAETHRSRFLTREELRHMFVKDKEMTADLSDQKRAMIDRVFELSSMKCQDIMIPRSNMEVIPIDTPLPEVLERAKSSELSRYPVYSREQQRFLGIVNIVDVLEHLDNENKQLRDIIRPPQYIPVDTPADELLPRMRISRQPLMLVRDRSSEVVGFITTNVILNLLFQPPKRKKKVAQKGKPVKAA